MSNESYLTPCKSTTYSHHVEKRKNAYRVIRRNPFLRTFTVMIDEAGCHIRQILRCDCITVFAPINKAFVDIGIAPMEVPVNNNVITTVNNSIAAMNRALALTKATVGTMTEAVTSAKATVATAKTVGMTGANTDTTLAAMSGTVAVMTNTMNTMNNTVTAARTAVSAIKGTTTGIPVTNMTPSMNNMGMNNMGMNTTTVSAVTPVISTVTTTPVTSVSVINSSNIHHRYITNGPAGVMVTAPHLAAAIRSKCCYRRGKDPIVYSCNPHGALPCNYQHPRLSLPPVIAGTTGTIIINPVGQTGTIIISRPIGMVGMTGTTGTNQQVILPGKCRCKEGGACTCRGHCKCNDNCCNRNKDCRKRKDKWPPSHRRRHHPPVAPVVVGPTGMIGPTDIVGPTGPTGALTVDQHTLTDMIKYHITPEYLTKQHFTNNAILDTLIEGETLRINVYYPPYRNIVTVNGAEILESKIAKNGVVHSIDKVLTPPPSDMTIWNLIKTTPNLSILAEAVERAHLISYLNETCANLTMFLPNNDAFDKLAVRVGVLVPTLASFLAARPEYLKSILEYHILDDVVFTPAFRYGITRKIKTVEGKSICVDNRTRCKPEVTIIDKLCREAMIVMPNILTVNGAAHIIDNVLLPKVC